MRRSGVILPAAGVAAIAVAGVSVAAWLIGPSVSGASGAAQAIEAIPNSRTVALLEQRRQQMIVMSAASRTLTVVAQPKLASPASAAATAVRAASGSPSSGGTTGSTTGSAPPPSRHRARSGHRPVDRLQPAGQLWIFHIAIQLPAEPMEPRKRLVL